MQLKGHLSTKKQSVLPKKRKEKKNGLLGDEVKIWELSLQNVHLSHTDCTIINAWVWRIIALSILIAGVSYWATFLCPGSDLICAILGTQIIDDNIDNVFKRSSDDSVHPLNLSVGRVLQHIAIVIFSLFATTFTIKSDLLTSCSHVCLCIRPSKRSTILCRESRRCWTDVAAVSETLLQMSGN